MSATDDDFCPLCGWIWDAHDDTEEGQARCLKPLFSATPELIAAVKALCEDEEPAK